MKTLTAAMDALKIPYDDTLIDMFEKHMKLVLAWNEKVNLTGITEKEDFIKKHYIDSLACYGWKELETAEVIIDVGTGAGFPGVPLAMVYPGKKFVLLDSAKKKLNIVEEIAKELGIKNISVIHGRAEDLASQKEHREKYDFCVSRAVAELSVLAELCIPFIKIGGTLAAYKTKTAKEEIAESLNAIKILGGKVEEDRPIEISQFYLNHMIVNIKKIEYTPAKFPRKAGTPKKQPLK